MICEAPLRLDPEKGIFVDSGADSSVYRYDDKVVKVYGSEITTDTLDHYRIITNCITHALRRTPFGGEFTADRQVYPYSIQVNPIIYAGYSDDFDRPISVSEYVSGPKMGHFTYPDSMGGFEPALEELNPREQEFLRGICSGSYEVYRSLGVVIRDIARIGEELGFCFRAGGIEIIQYNVKVRSFAADQLTFVVTDLCQHLTALSSC